MKRFKVVSFFLVFMCCSAVVFAVKAKDIPPWMEDIEESGRSTYLVPKGAKRKVVGSQIIIEAPSEYVARRLYEMEGYLQGRFKTIEENQEKFQKELEKLRGSVGKLENDDRLDQDLDEIKSVIEELSEFKRIIEESELSEELNEESGENEESDEGPKEAEEVIEEFINETEIP